MRPYLIVALVVAGIASAEPSPECRAWFEKNRLDAKSRQCFRECFTARSNIFGSCWQECDELCAPDIKIWLYFGNGMFNTKQEAGRSLDALTGKLYPFLKEKYPSTLRFLVEPSKAKLAYNTSELPVEQLLQVVDQKMNGHWENFFLYLSGWKAAPDWFTRAVRDTMKRQHEMNLKNDADLKAQVENYLSDLSAGDAILVVAHSQGNLYREEAFLHLGQVTGNRDLPWCGSVSVAPPTEHAPAGQFADSDWHTTLTSDYLIRSIPYTMPPNVTNTPSGLFDHFFVDHYLEGNRSGPKIMQDTACVLSKLNGVIMSPFTKFSFSFEDERPGCHGP